VPKVPFVCFCFGIAHFARLPLGIGGGLVGALIWFGVRRLTGYEVGLIAVVVGFLVGAGVRAGSGGRGGVGYQILALILTYFAVGVNYIPDVVSAGIAKHDPAGMIAFIAVFTFMVGPIVVAFHNLIGALIIGFALWEAWKLNRGKRVKFDGPFSLNGGTPAVLSPLPIPPLAAHP
jgi:hypothetical protein